MAKKKQFFSVSAVVLLDMTIEIEASSFEEAVQKSKSLTRRDFVDTDENINDSHVRIQGIYDEWKDINAF